MFNASPIQWTGTWANSGDGEGQGSLARCSPWGCKESDMTEQLNRTDFQNGTKTFNEERIV